MSPLHHFGEFLRGLLVAVPMPAVRFLFVATLLALLIWVIRLPRSATTPPGGAKRWDEHLKPVAGIAIIIQIVIYWMF